MSTAGELAPLELEQDLAAALDLLGRARRALARGELPDLGRLMALLESLRAALERPSGAGDRRLRRALLAVLDEAGIVAEQLREEEARVACELREAGAHQQAGAAYRRAGRL
ncbi:MAG TPA: hypothetical protein VLE23_07615 [Geminicoccaceae bacterium]|nr:hypothetical protein [Geminicoccaceae bacterium]